MYKQKATALLITTLLLSSCSLFGSQPAEAPDKVLREMQSKIQEREMKSGNVGGSLSFNVTQGKETMKFSVALDSDFDVTTEGNEKVQINTFSLSGEGNPAEGATVKGDAKMEMKYLNKTLYLLLKEITLPDMPEAGMPKEQLEAFIMPFKGTWYKYVMPEGTNPFSLKTTTESNASTETEAKIKELVKNTDFFVVTKDNGTEQLNGVDVYHYTVGLNADGITTFAQKVAEINGESMEETAIAELKDTLANKAKLDGELWIGVKDKYVYKGKFTLSINDAAQEMQGSFSGELVLNPNKTVSISEPTDAKDLLSELGLLLAPPTSEEFAPSDTTIFPEVPSTAEE